MQKLDQKPLDGHVLSSTTYLYNCFAQLAKPECVKDVYYRLENIVTKVPQSKVKKAINDLLLTIITDKQQYTYNYLLALETEFRELVESLKLAGLINVIVKQDRITGTVKVKDFLAVTKVYETTNLTVENIQMNKEKTEIFIELAKNAN